MNGFKSLFASKGVWGGILAFIPALDLIHQAISAAPAGVLPIAVQGALAGFGSVLALIGRISATQQIKF